MKSDLPVAGRGLAAIGLTGWLGYLIATRTSSVAHPPAWPYWLCLGMLVAGISLYLLGQQRSAASSRRAGSTDQGDTTDQNPDHGGKDANHAPLLANRPLIGARQSDTDDFQPRLLQELTLNAWIAALLFTASAAFLLQFRYQRSVNVSDALQELSARPIQTFIIMVLALIIVTIMTQVFSVDSIRVLEGYWGGRGLPGFVGRLMIQRHEHRRAVIINRLRKASEEALKAAMPQIILENDVPGSVVGALEAMVLGKAMPPLADEEREQLMSIHWRDWCDSWRLAKIDSLTADEMEYPAFSRIMPTKLGNVLRATEDKLRYSHDLSSFVLRRRGMLSRRAEKQRDQFRNRLELYCTLVFVSVSLVFLAPIMLLGRISVGSIVIISGFFAALGAASYHAAMASARGYCATLRQMYRTTDP